MVGMCQKCSRSIDLLFFCNVSMCTAKYTLITRNETLTQDTIRDLLRHALTRVRHCWRHVSTEARLMTRCHEESPARRSTLVTGATDFAAASRLSSSVVNATTSDASALMMRLFGAGVPAAAVSVGLTCRTKEGRRRGGGCLTFQ